MLKDIVAEVGKLLGTTSEATTTTTASTISPASEPADKGSQTSKASSCFRVHDAQDGRGRGLFATKNLSVGVLIHEAPCLLISRDSYDDHARFTVMEHYLFNCADGDKLLALGYGSLFNHSDSPNVDYRLDKASLTIRYFAARSIAAGEEMCIYYGNNLWFQEKNAAGDGEAVDDIDINDSDSSDEDFLSRMSSLPDTIAAANI